MSEKRDKEAEAIQKWRDVEAAWTAEVDPESTPFTAEEARHIVNHYGGWRHLEEGLKGLVEAREGIEKAEEKLPPELLPSEMGEMKQQLDASILRTDRILEVASDAEEALRREGLQSSKKDNHVTIVSEGGRPTHLFTREVERLYREELQRRRDGSYPNTDHIRAKIREELSGNFPPEKLEDDNLYEIVKRIKKRIRKN